MPIDLSKQQALYANPKPIQQINFTGNVDRAAGATLFSIIEEAKKKKKIIFFSKNCEIIVNVFHNFILF